MGWILPSLFLLIASAYNAKLNRVTTRQSLNIAFYLVLILLIISVMGMKAFRGSETNLIGFFVVGLMILAAGEVLAARKLTLAAWSQAAVPPAALAFALGFDVLRPDAYSYIPAAIVAVMVAIVGWRCYRRLSPEAKKKSYKGLDTPLLLYILAVGILTYSALFKMIDRGWALPWAYLASAGALLFAAAQLWLGWEKVLKEKRVADWVRRGAFDLSVLMIVVGALFVYREFL
jgi:hypothetical protein